MSLSIVLPTHYGIIMSADRRTMTTIFHENSTETFLQSDHEKKLFVLPCNYGLSYVGSSSVNGIPLSSIIEKLILTIQESPSDPRQMLNHIAEQINILISDSSFSVLILSGYFKTNRFILSINTKTLEMTEHPVDNTIIYSGNSDILETIVKNYNYDYEKFNLTDAISFVTLLNKTTACLQHFQQRPQTVSEACDLLTIKPNITEWIGQ